MQSLWRNSLSRNWQLWYDAIKTVVGMIADGMIEEEILRAYPDLEHEDIREALKYAAQADRERELPLITS